MHCDTLHVTYHSLRIHRGNLFVLLRRLAGFRLIGFYTGFVFCVFDTAHNANQAKSLLYAIPGIAQVDFAKQTYYVPYPQPTDHEEKAMCPSVIHVTHLPPNYTRDEISVMCFDLDGMKSVQFYGKYCYATFESHAFAATARATLRSETNLVVTFARPKPGSSESAANTEGIQTVQSLEDIPAVTYRPVREASRILPKTGAELDLMQFTPQYQWKLSMQRHPYMEHEIREQQRDFSPARVNDMSASRSRPNTPQLYQYLTPSSNIKTGGMRAFQAPESPPPTAESSDATKIGHLGVGSACGGAGVAMRDVVYAMGMTPPLREGGESGVGWMQEEEVEEVVKRHVGALVKSKVYQLF
ncbi:hypothetical protein HDU98_006054 [Podochytrium sp. JEL0797]|nr:hypothetical protein HDU98_006054 [Podochytrium sp. JEL0797]